MAQPAASLADAMKSVDHLSKEPKRFSMAARTFAPG